MARSHISGSVFVVKLPSFCDLNFRAQIMQEGLCNRAGQELSLSPWMEPWMVSWFIEHELCNEGSDSPLLGSKSVKMFRFCVKGAGIFVKCMHSCLII